MVKGFDTYNMPPPIQTLDEFEMYGEKVSGGQLGGIYKLKEAPQELFMIKRMQLRQTISEYVGSNLARLIIGNKAPLVNLVKDQKGNIYTCSKFIKGFQTLFEYIKQSNIPRKCLPNGCLIDESGEIHPILSYMKERFEQSKITYPPIDNIEEVNLAMEFVIHDDAHEGNRGIILDGSSIQAAVVDFSLSLGNLENSIIYYYYDNYDNKKIIQAINQILSIPIKEINQLIDILFENLLECYGDQYHKDLQPHKKDIKEGLLARQEFFKAEKFLIMLQDTLETSHITNLNYFEHMITSGSLSFSRFNSLTLQNVIKSLIETNNLPILDSLIKNNKQLTEKVISNLLQDAVNNNLDRRFQILFPYIQDDLELLQNPLIQAIQNNQDEMFNRLLAKMHNHPEFLEKALKVAIDINNDAMFNQIFPYMAHRPEFLRDALGSIVENNKEEIFTKVLPYVKDHPEFLEKALDRSVDINNEAMFNKILPYIKHRPQLLKQALITTTWRNRDKMFDELLSEMRNQPDILIDVLKYVISNHRSEMFKKIVPLIDFPVLLRSFADCRDRQLYEYSCYALEIMLKDNQSENVVKMLEYFIANEMSLYDVIGQKQQIFTDLLPYLTDFPAMLEETLIEVVQNKQGEMLEKLLPYMKNQPETLKRVMFEAVNDKNYEMFSKMLPYIQEDTVYMEKIINKVFQYDTYNLIKHMIPYVINVEEVTDKLFLHAIKNNNIKIFNLLLQEIGITANVAYLVSAQGSSEMKTTLINHVGFATYQKIADVANYLNFLPDFPVANAESVVGLDSKSPALGKLSVKEQNQLLNQVLENVPVNYRAPISQLTIGNASLPSNNTVSNTKNLSNLPMSDLGSTIMLSAVIGVLGQKLWKWIKNEKVSGKEMKEDLKIVQYHLSKAKQQMEIIEKNISNAYEQILEKEQILAKKSIKYSEERDQLNDKLNKNAKYTPIARYLDNKAKEEGQAFDEERKELKKIKEKLKSFQEEISEDKTDYKKIKKNYIKLQNTTEVSKDDIRTLKEESKDLKSMIKEEKIELKHFMKDRKLKHKKDQDSRGK